MIPLSAYICIYICIYIYIYVYYIIYIYTYSRHNCVLRTRLVSVSRLCERVLANMVGQGRAATSKRKGQICRCKRVKFRVQGLESRVEGVGFKYAK